MDIFRDESEFTDVRMVQRVMDLFECRPGFQKIVRLGLVAGMKCDDEDGTDKSSDRGLSGSHTRSSGSVYPLPLHYYASSRAVPCPHSVKVEAKESDSERKARLLEEVKRVKEKVEKKRLKKMKRKERRRLQKLEREKHNPVKSEAQSKTEGSEPVNDESKINTISSDKQCASAKDTDSSDSSDDESSDEDSDTRNDSGDSQELDMTSTFVSKAALIARRKLEQKPKPEMREKKKTPVKPNEDPDVEKKDSATRSSPTLEDNVKISTDLAVIGNRFASAGDFNMAVKYFTDAIKYNPTELKLFGNRSFCFEKMQEYEKALTDAELSLSMWPGWVKGLFRRGRALAGLKRYEEAGRAFREVLKLDSSCAEAAQELMRVQITQLMAYGFTREQSSNALIIHGTVQKAQEVLSKLNHRPGSIHSNGTVQPAQVANLTGVSPVLSANTIPAPQSHDAPKPAFQNKSNVHSQPMKTNNVHPPQELFPVWVGNLVYPVAESVIANMFSKVGAVSSVKVLTYKRCAFVNFTKQEHCDEAIRRFHGCELNGIKIAVRYPDRIPQGLGISRSAIKAVDLQDDNMRQSEYSEAWNAVGSRRPFRPYRPVPDYRGNY
ncbi:hypothetical protein VZT92_017077 [Zoarces viviparus]|uniref:RRM domain-containing protein n=1 Tax=Zoarces viviparus TaxID=48416 RepID=A0AAW1ER76_ZOAVI